MTGVVIIILLAFMVVILRTKPAVADVTITAIRYTLDDVTWIGLDGATLEPGHFKVSVTWKNNSSEPIDTLLTLVVEDQGQEPDEERVTLAPEEDVTAALVMEFMEGSRKVTATIYNRSTMDVLDTKTVNVSVLLPPPICTLGETKCEGYNLYECQLVDENPDWVLKETNSEACGYVPPPPPPVCGIGETKCEGFDLYECQLVEGDAAWVLTETNSTTCGYVPPSPAEFVLSDLVIGEETVQLGEWVSASVTATNIGAEGGNCTVTIERTGKATASQTKFIAAGQKESIGWGWKPTILGTHTVKFIGPTNDLSDTFTVTDEPPPPPPPEPRPAKKGELEVINLKWITPPPFMAPQRPQWEITLKNLVADRLKFNMMLQYSTWHTEGGWSETFEIAGRATDTFQASTIIPAEPGTWPGSVAFGVNWWTGGIAIETVQNPDALVPNQSPPEFDDWTGLKEFPLPHSNYGVQFDAIRLPMLSRSNSVQGEIDIYLLAPKDCQDWGEYAGKFGTERRLDLTGLKWCNPETEGDYTYTVIINVAGLEGSASKKLTRNDNSGIYTLPITLPKTSEPLGARLPVSIRVYFSIVGGEYGHLHLLWSPDVYRYHLHCTLGYINVGTPPPPPPDYITRELALQMIDEHSVSLGPIGYMGKTDDGGMPDWNPYYDPQDIHRQWAAICGYEVGVRYCIMDGRISPPKDLYYYRNIYDRWEQMWKPDPLGLPFYIVGLTWTDAQGITRAHWICALRVGADASSFSSWVFFNYYDREIMPGNVEQMPYGARVSVYKSRGVTDAGHSWPTGLAIAEWNV